MKTPRPIFLNWKGPQGRETVDCVEHDPRYWPDARAMRKEAARLCGEYAVAGMAVYTSSRPCKGWN